MGIQVLGKKIAQHVIHSRYQKTHVVSQISESIWRMGCGHNFTTDNCEQLHITNVKEVYGSSNKLSYIRQMLKHNDWCSGLDYM